MKELEKKLGTSQASLPTVLEISSSSLQTAVMFLGTGTTESTIDKVKVKSLISQHLIHGNLLLIETRDQKSKKSRFHIIPMTNVKSVTPNEKYQLTFEELVKGS